MTLPGRPPQAHLPANHDLRLCLAHAVYDLKPVFDGLGTGIAARQVRSRDDLLAALPETDVLVVSGLWTNDLLSHAPKLKYVQSVSSGTNQYDRDAFRAHGVMLASGQGVNVNAVSEHAFGLMLSLTRRLAEARDNQHSRLWRPSIGDATRREDELAGKTLLVVGLGGIGQRIARIGRAFDMHVLGIRRDPANGAGAAESVHSFAHLTALLPQADVVVLCCPLTDETRHLMNARTLDLLKPTALLVNVARGGCVDEAALIDALAAGRFAGAGIDVTEREPLPESSPLWTLPNVVLTPHTAGETRLYERNVIAILARNLQKLRQGDTDLVNRIV